MSAQAEIPRGHPMRDAWEAYKATAEYANSRNWALKEAHVDGSMWAAFCAGYKATAADAAVGAQGEWPMFTWSGLAPRKLGELRKQGWAVNGYALYRNGERGLIDLHGAVHWIAAPAAGKGVDFDAWHDAKWPEPEQYGHKIVWRQRKADRRAAWQAALTRQPVAEDGLVLVGWASRKQIDRLRTESGLTGIMVHDEKTDTINVPMFAAPAATPTDGGEG